MLPFNDPNFQQGILFNPNFNSQNAFLGNLSGANLNNFQGPNPNLQPMVENNQLGVLQLLAAQIQSNPQLQINLLHQLQSQNLAAAFQQGGIPFLGHNPNQMMGMLNGQLLALNQMLQANQMMGFLGNPQLAQSIMGLGFGNAPSTVGHNPVCGSPSAVTESKTQQKKNNMQYANGSQQLQVNHVEGTDNLHVDSQNSATKAQSFGFGKKLSHNRCQKSQLHDMRNSKRNMKQFSRRGGKGQNDWREQKLQFTKTGEEASTICRRPLSSNYTKMEIQLWREARKKNFPTRDNVNKKKASGVGNNEDADSKLRRQQLKQILAKQAELGVEVAEIPLNYLYEPEELVTMKENEREATDGPSPNRFDRKRGRGHGRDNWHSKRGRDHDNWRSRKQKFKNNGAQASPPCVKREPSLLEKLLSADIKRDKSRLLQVLRFTVLNNFFKQWPAKAMEFPIVTVKDDEWTGSDIVGERDLSLGAAESLPDVADEKTVSEGIDCLKESGMAGVKCASDEEDNVDTSELPNRGGDEEIHNGEQFALEEGEITD